MINWLGSFFKSAKPPTDDIEVKSAGAYTLDDIAKKMFNGTSSFPLNIEAFYSCVRDKAETIAQLPLNLYKTTKTTRERQLQGRYHRIFTQRPCEHMSFQEFMEMLVLSVETYGVFYAYISRNDLGEVMEIVPFANQRNVSPRMDVNGVVYYTYSDNAGKPVIAALPEDLFIIRMMTTDGYNVVSPIRHQARLLNIAGAQDDNWYDTQTNGITGQMALKTELAFKDPNAAERVRDDFTNMIRGKNGNKKIPILEQGLTPISLKVTPKDAELLGNKEFTVNRICRMTRVPLHRIGAATSDSKATPAELDEAYMRDSLNPYLVKVEHAINRLLPSGLMVEFNRKAFYAGSPWRLVEAVEREVKGGLASINEGRIDLGRETIEGGDIFAIDNNNVTYGQWTEVKEIQEQLYGQAQQNLRDQQNEKPTK